MGLPAVWAMSTRLLISAKAASKPAQSTGQLGGWFHSAQETSQKEPRQGSGAKSVRHAGRPVRRQTLD